MSNLSGIVKQLSKERDRLHQQLSGLNTALEAFAVVYRGTNGLKPRRKSQPRAALVLLLLRKPAGRKSRALQRYPKKRTMSAAARRKIAAAQRARWAKVKQGKKAA